ncbi:MAG TPA: YifB family Mg chelatase-like AAA ATPase [Actinomycetales bacterium]|nr:YifB family Mg chelatase-like AAA ATPase [Actinomycetales bacterium]
MTVGRTQAVALVGLQGHLVEVEADIASQLPAFVLVGLPDASLSESRDRVRAAVQNAGFSLPARRITVNLSPASLPKTGSSFDLAIAVGVLGACGAVDRESAESTVHLGELGLDGRLRPVRGVLPMVLAAVRAGRSRVVVPAGNVEEARLVPGARVLGAVHLNDVVRAHGGDVDPGDDHVPVRMGVLAERAPDGGPGDLSDVLGQVEARRALEVAAAGGHHLLLLGPPGAGKTMLAARLPGLLPDLDDAAAVEVTAVHSLSGTFDPVAGLIRRPPFEDPHHTATAAAVVGGGSGMPSPGAASRAHRGVLLLDEAPEFAPRVLEALRQPLEHGELVIARSKGMARYPARFQLVLAANPCPCGLLVGKGTGCDCPPVARRRYLARLSGPLLDRVDLQVEVLPVSRAEMARDDTREPTAVVAARVAAARAAQRERLGGTPWACNGEVPGTLLRQEWRLAAATTAELDRAIDRGSLTVRGYDRVLRTAWTIADLAGSTSPSADQVSRALNLRQRGQAAA